MSAVQSTAAAESPTAAHNVADLRRSPASYILALNLATLRLGRKDEDKPGWCTVSRKSRSFSPGYARVVRPRVDQVVRRTHSPKSHVRVWLFPTVGPPGPHTPNIEAASALIQFHNLMDGRLKDRAVRSVDKLR